MPARSLGRAPLSRTERGTARGGPGGGARRGSGRGRPRRSAGRVGTWAAGGSCRLVLPPVVSKVVCHLHAGLAVGGPLGKSLRRQRLAVSQPGVRSSSTQDLASDRVASAPQRWRQNLRPASPAAAPNWSQFPHLCSWAGSVWRLKINPHKSTKARRRISKKYILYF